MNYIKTIVVIFFFLNYQLCYCFNVQFYFVGRLECLEYDPINLYLIINKKNNVFEFYTESAMQFDYIEITNKRGVVKKHKRLYHIDTWNPPVFISNVFALKGSKIKYEIRKAITIILKNDSYSCKVSNLVLKEFFSTNQSYPTLNRVD